MALKTSSLRSFAEKAETAAKTSSLRSFAEKAETAAKARQVLEGQATA